MITIVDYGMGNLGSIHNMFRHIGVAATISSRAADIEAASKLILPGVGAFDTAMRNLRQSGLISVLEEKVFGMRTPILGLCLGMQILMDGSEEGQIGGLGWIPGETRRFQFPEGTKLPVPHMGWNTAEPAGDSRFLSLEPTDRFYFVHSYHAVCADSSHVAAWTEYGYRFASVVRKGHIAGTQFHPEKSHRFGMKVLAQFAEWTGC